MSEYKRPELEYHADGIVKDFSVPDAHTLEVSCRSSRDVTVSYFKETFVLFSLDELDNLHKLVDPYDNYTLAEKWVINEVIVKDLKSKGEASQVLPPFVYTYALRKTLNADNLRHRG